MLCDNLGQPVSPGNVDLISAFGKLVAVVHSFPAQAAHLPILRYPESGGFRGGERAGWLSGGGGRLFDQKHRRGLAQLLPGSTTPGNRY